MDLEHQIEKLRPFFGRRDTSMLIASLAPTGHSWELAVHLVPGDRRPSIQAACAGRLTLAKKRLKAPSSESFPTTD